MRVLVLMEMGADVRIPPERDPRSGRVREERLVRETDPDCARALDLALRFKAGHPDVEVTLVHVGSGETEPWLRRALAQGADRVVRIWDDEAAGTSAAGKAVILAAAAQVAGFDLILAGSRGVIAGAGQVGVLVAARLGVPCATQVVDVVAKAPGTALAANPTLAANQALGANPTLEVTRALDRGFHERVQVSLPAVATVSSAGSAPGTETTAGTETTTEMGMGAAGPGSEAPPAITARALLAALAKQITVWSLADLGVPLDHVRRAERVLAYGRPRPRRPRLRPLAAPDSALPSFDRILKLIEGSVKRRQGRMVNRPVEETVEEIFATLRDEGWLDHLRPGAQRDPRGRRADARATEDEEAAPRADDGQ